MAVTSSDLRVPKGPVDAKLFPGLASRAVDARLDGYIVAAGQEPAVLVEADVDKKDKMIRARSLYYVFRDVYIDMVRRPAELQVAEEGTHRYNAQQLAAMQKLRDDYLAEYEELLPPIVETPPSKFVGTISTRTRVNWT